MTPPGSPSCQTLERNRGRCQLTPAMLCNETAADLSCVCTKRGCKNWYLIIDIDQAGWNVSGEIKRTVGRRMCLVGLGLKSAGNYDWKVLSPSIMSFLTKLPQEVLEQVSHIVKQKTPSQMDHSGTTTTSGMGNSQKTVHTTTWHCVNRWQNIFLVEIWLDWHSATPDCTAPLIRSVFGVARWKG